MGILILSALLGTLKIPVNGYYKRISENKGLRMLMKSEKEVRLEAENKEVSKTGKVFYRGLLVLSFLSLVTAVAMLAMGHGKQTGPFVMMIFAPLALYVRSSQNLRGLSFTLWVLTAVTASMYYPHLFLSWGGFRLSRLIVPLIQLIMFGMGTTLAVRDFARVAKMPHAVLVGMLLQFTVMPIVGFTLASVYGFSPLIATGIILVGSCPGGVASNVITYLARGNVALSVTMTACSTLLSPIMTPLAMWVLANRYTHIDVGGMMISIVKMIILPIVAGLIANRLLHRFSKWRDRVLPVFSMVCLCLIITIITSLSRDALLGVGLALISVSVLHNALGYTFGYWGGRLARLEETACRTIAIEVGLQNGGMASGIAMDVLKSAEAGLAPAIFGAYMNVSGSVLASWWKGKPIKQPTSRSNIYYWKCDNTVPVEEKQTYNKKYQVADISDLVRRIADDYYNGQAVDVVCGNGAGNHYTYIIKTKDRDVFFRADDGKTDDDYMDAEVAAMELVRKHGVPVPEVYHCDTSLSNYPVRFQMMERVSGESMNHLDQKNALDRRAVGMQLGGLLAKMHSIQLDGFGFIDTNILHQDSRIVGLDKTNRDYFYKNLDTHIGYLRDHKFLEAEQSREIRTLIDKHSDLLALDRGSVVHKDVAFWNMIGTEKKINAIIDWDDVIIGDPADDIAVLRCFYDDVVDYVCQRYGEHILIDDRFRARTSLYLVRNMLWKAVIRSFMNYFDAENGLFMKNDTHEKSLKEITYEKLFTGVEELRKL